MQIQGLIGSQEVGKGADGLFSHGSRPAEPLNRNNSGTNWLLSPGYASNSAPGDRGFALGWFRLVGWRNNAGTNWQAPSGLNGESCGFAQFPSQQDCPWTQSIKEYERIMLNINESSLSRHFVKGAW